MANIQEKKLVLELKQLKQYFPIDRTRAVKAVDGIDLSIYQGEIMGLVGESGSGKSTIAYSVMGMYKPTAGEIIFNGEEISATTKKRSKQFRKNMQIVFQDPGSSLNPYQTVQQILEILEMVELPKSFLYKSPNAIGGGEKQLVSIARALCSNPQFIILDEPTSSLDVSIQAKIINMLLRIHEERQLTYLLITHDLSLMRNISTRVAIMYLGKICEIAETDIFYTNPMHPYTQMLLSAIPVISEEEEKLKPAKVVSTGEIPSPVNVPKGCSFNTRCSKCMSICKEVDPELKELEPGHFVRCHLFDDN